MVHDIQKGKVQTVLGIIDPTNIGPVLMHEHLLLDLSFIYDSFADESHELLAHQPVSLSNLGWIRQNCYSNIDNLIISDENDAAREAILYRLQGGNTIVEVTPIGVGRDPLALARISKTAGINIVAGTSYYVDNAHPPEIEKSDESDIQARFVSEIVTGIDNTNVKAGIIGEIGCSWPLTKNERKVLRAAAGAQRSTGAAISIHPGRYKEAPLEILEILKDSGADLNRVIMGHIDRTIDSVDGLLNLVATGCVLEFDLFGTEVSFHPWTNFDMPNDTTRMDLIKAMIDNGWADKIVISHDICTKHRLVKYGGHGYGYILEYIVPRMIKRGFEEDDIYKLLHSNPTRLLTFA